MKTSRIQWCPEAQQQAILALGTALDAPSDADRAFFTRHPERDYLVRRARKVELRANEIVMGGKLQKPDGFRWYYAVQRVEFGRMKRLFSAAPLHHPERFSDAACRMVFEQVGDAAA